MRKNSWFGFFGFVQKGLSKYLATQFAYRLCILQGAYNHGPTCFEKMFHESDHLLKWCICELSHFLGSLSIAIYKSKTISFFMQQNLYFAPLSQGHGS
jgi:hypothetical protein